MAHIEAAMRLCKIIAKMFMSSILSHIMTNKKWNRIFEPIPIKHGKTVKIQHRLREESNTIKNKNNVYYRTEKDHENVMKVP